MGILVTCNCGRTARAKESFAGRQVACPRCGRLLDVPPSNASSVARVDPGPALPNTPLQRAGEETQGIPRIVEERRIRLGYLSKEPQTRTLVDIVRKANQMLDDPFSNSHSTDSDMEFRAQSLELDQVQGELIERLSPIAKAAARQFFGRIGVTDPLRFRAGDLDRLFTHMRSRARLGLEFGDAYYLDNGHSAVPAKEFLYISQAEHDGTTEYGLLVCKLRDGVVFACNTLDTRDEILGDHREQLSGEFYKSPVSPSPTRPLLRLLSMIMGFFKRLSFCKRSNSARVSRLVNKTASLIEAGNRPDIIMAQGDLRLLIEQVSRITPAEVLHILSEMEAGLPDTPVWTPKHSAIQIVREFVIELSEIEFVGE